MIHESSAFHTVWNVTIRIYPEACPVEEGDDILSHRGTSFNAEHRLYLPMLTDYTWPSISDLIPDSKKIAFFCIALDYKILTAMGRFTLRPRDDSVEDNI